MLRTCLVALAVAIAAPAARADEETDLSGPALRFYGFADFSYDRYLFSTDSGWNQYRIFPDTGAFSVGKLNLFIDGQISSRARSLVEVRFSYLGGVDPLVSDYSENSSSVPAAGIVLERAWVEYQFADALTVRVGQFLTPYGVWNVDHASPTLVDVFPPYVITQQILPRSQVGFEAYGSKLFGKATVGWHFTVSNGRSQSVSDDHTGSVPAYESFNHRLAFGGRAWVEGHWLGTLRIGASAFTGRYTEKDHATAALVQQYDEVSWATDLKWEYARFLVVAEAMQQRVAFTPDGADAFAQAMGGAYPDYDSSGWYVLSGYRIPGLELMPFVMAQRHVPNDNKPHQSMYAVTGGLNLRLLPNLVLKASLTKPVWPEAKPENKPYSDSLLVAAAQVAWAF